MCRAKASPGFTLKCLHELFRKRFKEFPWDGESALGKSDGSFLGTTRLQRTNFGDRLVAFAKQDCLSVNDHGEVTGQMGLGLMNVKSNHVYNLNQIVN